MDINFFKKTRILDAGMGQELLARGMKPQGTLRSATAILNKTNIKPGINQTNTNSKILINDST